MATEKNDNLRVLAPKHIDERYQKYDPVLRRGVPFDDVDEMRLAIPREMRYEGLTGFVLKEGGRAEYWWRDDIENDDLIEKTVDVEGVAVTKGDLGAGTGPLVINWALDVVPGEGVTYEGKHGIIDEVVFQFYKSSPVPGNTVWSQYLNSNGGIDYDQNTLTIDNEGDNCKYVIMSKSQGVIPPPATALLILNITGLPTGIPVMVNGQIWTNRRRSFPLDTVLPELVVTAEGYDIDPPSVPAGTVMDTNKTLDFTATEVIPDTFDLTIDVDGLPEDYDIKFEGVVWPGKKKSFAEGFPLYNLTPQADGYVFSPPAIATVIMDADKTLHFEASPDTGDPDLFDGAAYLNLNAYAGGDEAENIFNDWQLVGTSGIAKCQPLKRLADEGAMAIFKYGGISSALSTFIIKDYPSDLDGGTNSEIRFDSSGVLSVFFREGADEVLPTQPTTGQFIAVVRGAPRPDLGPNWDDVIIRYYNSDKTTITYEYTSPVHYINGAIIQFNIVGTDCIIQKPQGKLLTDI